MVTVKKVGAYLGTGLAAITGFLYATAANAQVNYNSQLSTTTDLVQAIGDDVLDTVLVVIGIIVSIGVLLMLVGYGWRKFGKLVGRKF